MQRRRFDAAERLATRHAPAQGHGTRGKVRKIDSWRLEHKCLSRLLPQSLLAVGCGRNHQPVHQHNIVLRSALLGHMIFISADRVSTVSYSVGSNYC